MNIDSKAKASKKEENGGDASKKKRSLNAAIGPGGKCINCMSEEITSSEKKNIGYFYSIIVRE